MINIGSGLVTISLPWPAFKAMASSKVMNIQYVDDGTAYTLFAVDGSIAYVSTLYQSTLPNGVSDVIQSDNDTWKTDFETNFKTKANAPTVPRTTDGRPRMINEKPVLSRINFYSFDWSDPTTWYPQSVLVTGETPTNANGDLQTFQLAHVNIIDTYHGKITLEDGMKDAAGNSYRVGVLVNGVAKVEQDPHFGTGRDYTIDYDHGRVIFLAPLLATDTVAVTYHYATGSRFTIAPAAGKKLTVYLAEVQFSRDVVMNDSLVLQVMGFADAFAPQIVGTGPGQVPSGTKIPIMTFTYKTLSDFQNDSMRSYVAYPALGGTNWRAQAQDILIFDWDYIAATAIKASAGMEMRLSLAHDTPFAGWMATATFYALSEVDA